VQEQEGEALVNDVDDEKLQQYKRLINATSYFQQYDHLVRMKVSFNRLLFSEV
jgi:hypothetical protein